MQKLVFTFLFLFLGFAALQAQIARVQIIHNAPEPTVDVYANGEILLDDFRFRTATPFVDLPAGVNIRLDIAPASSTSAADAIASFDATFEENRTYIVTASGLVGGSPGFGLNIFDAAREAAADPDQVDVAVLHGSPDAPAVDVDAVFVANNLIENLAYGEVAGYLSLPAAKYDLAVRAAGDPNVVASFRADLSGLAGGAGFVFASGLLGGTPGFGLFVALPDGKVEALPLTPTARVQIIHNSPDPTVDIYAGNTLLLNDFAFRAATPFIDVPADRDLNVGVALPNSQSAADAIANFPVNFTAGGKFVVMAAGLVGGSPGFNLFVNAAAREAATDPANVDVAVFHGSPDAPAVDVDATFVANDVVKNLAFGEYTGYLSLPAGKYDLAVRATGDPNVVASFRADLSGLAGGAATVFASGLLGGTPGFGLFAALPNGTVVALPLTPTARVQIIHNAPDPTVDIYVGNTLLLNDFAFRAATPFIDVPADRDLNVGVALPNSQSAADAIANFPVNFTAGGKFVVMAAGLVGGSPGFNLFVNAAAREAATDPANVDVAVFHGSPDAPAVDVDATFVANDVVKNLEFGQFTGYLSLPAGKYDLAVRATGDPNVVASFRADLSGLAGGAATVFASGLLAGTPGFGLFAALPNGTVVALPLTPTARVQIIHNSPDPTVDIYAGNSLLLNDFAFRAATPFIDVPADRDLNVGVALPNSQSANDAIANFPVNFTAGGKFVVMAAGLVGGTPGFNLFVNAAARETSGTAGNVDVAVFHGSPDAPAVDVDATFVADNVITGLEFGQFTNYLSLPAGKYDLVVKLSGLGAIVGSYRADASGLAGGAGTIFASGLAGGTPGFGLFLALPDGTVAELPTTPTTRVQIIHNALAPAVDVYAGNTLLINDFDFRTATPFIEVPADRSIGLGVAPANSQSASDALAVLPATFASGKTYVAIAAGVLAGAPGFNLFINENAREAATDAGNVDVAVFHGSPDAPAVDVDAAFVANNVVSNLAFGQFTDYLGLPADLYDLAIRAAGDPNVVASFRADISGLAGGAATVFASGLLAGTPGFGLFAALPDGTVIALPATPTARVQIIHNAPDPTVDIYAGNTLLLNDFAFRTATPFINVPADRNFNVGVALPNSQSANDAIANFPVRFVAGERYVVTAAGLVGGTPGFNLFVNATARETSGTAGNVDVAVFHGSPDAPAVDADATFVANNVVSNLAFGEYTGYLSLPAAKYDLAIRASGNPNVVASFRADLSGLAGGAATVFASGLLGGTPGFGLFAALPNGTVVALPLTPTARVQIIHNAPDPTVDIYAGNTLLLNDFAFRKATPFIDVPADRDLNVGVALPNSQSANDAIANFPVNFTTGGKFVVMAAGLVGGTPGFNLFVNAAARETSGTAGNVDLAVFHGSPDAPVVDVDALFVAANLVEDLAFGQFTDYLSLPADLYDLQVRQANSASTFDPIFRADLSGLAGGAATVFASGLYTTGNPDFGLFAALPNGTVIELPATPMASVQIIHNSPSPTVDIYINGQRTITNFAFRTAAGFLSLPAERDLRISVAPAPSNSVNDAIFNTTLNLDEVNSLSSSYVVTAAGVVGNSGATAFNLFVKENARETANNANNVAIQVFHGVTDAPEVDVILPNGTVLFDNISFGEYSDYVFVPAGTYTLYLTPANDNSTVLAAYILNAQDPLGIPVNGGALTVFASGFLNGVPGFGLFAARSAGLVYPLQVTTSTGELSQNLKGLALWPNPTSDELQIGFNLDKATALRYRVFDLNGKMIAEGDFGTVSSGEFREKLPVGELPVGLYHLQLVGENGTQTARFQVQR